MLRAPHIKAFTNEKNASEINNIVNVSYGTHEKKVYEQDVDPIHEKTRDIEIEQNTKSEKILKLMLEAYKNNHYTLMTI